MAAASPAASAVTPSHAATPAAIGSPAVSLDTVLADLQAFARATPHPAVLVAATQVIMYDPFAVSHDPGIVVAETYDFSDGSSISLVGLPSELAHAHMHGIG
jgi:hypothetical protein